MASENGPLILAIETATRAGSVALARGNETLSAMMGDATVSHSQDLISAVDEVLRRADVKPAAVDLFAAAVGPGSFTGLRIGLATAKSFAVCMGKRCAGVSTLAAIAHAAGESEATVALLPAGRGEVFAQLFAVRSGEVQELDTAAHLPLKLVLEKYGEARELVWAGEGAHQQLEALRAGAKDRARSFGELAPGAGESPAEWSLAPRVGQLAASIAALALQAYRNGNTVDPDELRAEYVRASDAEINERWQREKAQQLALE
jgi:tRNA threonylcarbamoyladenosine biosynthesis protein TsaB